MANEILSFEVDGFKAQMEIIREVPGQITFNCTKVQQAVDEPDHQVTVTESMVDTHIGPSIDLDLHYQKHTENFRELQAKAEESEKARSMLETLKGLLGGEGPSRKGPTGFPMPGQGSDYLN